MNAEDFVQKLKMAGIDTATGIPDSTLKPFCDYVESRGKDAFRYHTVPENEGAAVGIAIGAYLSTGKAACVYMQNSGLGNAVNPLTSLAHREVYGVPMLLLVGWRGEPGTEDEPQHRFMGRATLGLLELLEIPYAVVDGGTTAEELDGILGRAREAFACGRQYAVVARKGTFEESGLSEYQNGNRLVREEAVREIAGWLKPEDVIVSTTGKISRELYEQLDALKGNHGQAFLTVGGMGHAKMVAYGIAQRDKGRRVVCLDGDGALLMHMGGMAVAGRHPQENLVHICLDNEAHESVGGMATGAAGLQYERVAEECGYRDAYLAETGEELRNVLRAIDGKRGMAFVRVKVALGSRGNLGRPKETPEGNRKEFMEKFRKAAGERG